MTLTGTVYRQLINCIILILGTLMSSQMDAQTKIIAHRGAWKSTGLPQNSLASLKASVSMGCDGSEFDIHLTKDSVLVVAHDSDYFGLAIDRHDFEALNVHQLSNGESLPRLTEFYDFLKDQKDFLLFAEIKTSPLGLERTETLALHVYNLTQQYGLLTRTVFISFSMEALLKIKQLDSEAHVQYLTGDKDVEELQRLNISGLDYHYSVFEKYPEWIQMARARGLSTNVWTVNDADKAKALTLMGVNFITTDIPEQLLQDR